MDKSCDGMWWGYQTSAIAGLATRCATHAPCTCPLAPLAVRSRKRPFKLPAATPVIVDRMAEQSAITAVPAAAPAQKARNTKAAEEVWEYFTELGRYSAIWSKNLDTPVHRQRAHDLLVDEWAAVSAIRSHMGVLTDWIEFCNKQGTSWKTPDSISVRCFIKSFSGDGSSVPKKNDGGLRWMELNIGLEASTSLDRVRRCGDPPPPRPYANPGDPLEAYHLVNARKLRRMCQ